MKVYFYPQLDEKKTPKVSLEDFLSNLRLDHPDLWTLVRKTIEQAEKPEGIDVLRKSQRVSILRGLQDPIWEFRIPPRRRGGVVRIYFFFNKGDSDSIICLNAEFKKVIESSRQKILAAQRIYQKIQKGKK